MRIYVINLDRSFERLAHVTDQFSQLNLGFTRIAAVDAFGLNEQKCQIVQGRNIWTQALTCGEIACFLSHEQALQQFLIDDAPYGAIFEDDVILGGSAREWLSERGWLTEVADKTGEVPEIVKLETSGKKVWLGQGVRLGESTRSDFTLAKLKSTHIMGAAYLISRSGAMKLLALMQEKSAPFDHFMFNFSLGNVQKFALYQLDPAIAIQAPLPSTLESERAQDKRRQKQGRSFGQTLRREARRLVCRSRRGLWGLKTNLFTREQWKRVPFQQ